jgi:transcriptional regulator with XRE-family HTH domain
MRSNDDLRGAVRGLRAAMGKTQTEFGTMLGKSLPTIQRYESLVPPKGKILIDLERLARDARFDEYAQIFREAVRVELGVELPATTPIPVALPFPRVAGINVPGPHTPEQQLTHDTLQVLMDEATWLSPNGDEARKEMQVVNRALRRVRLQLEDAGQGNQPLADRVAAVLRHRRDGLRPSQIAKKMHISTEEVESLLSQYEGDQK